MPAITLTSAAAMDTNRVRVTTSSEPMHSGRAFQGDALNPRTWRVVRDDTGDDLPVASVAEINATTYDLVVGTPFGDQSTLHYAMSATIVAIDGTPMADDSWVTFIGIVAAPKTQVTAGCVDFLNAPVPQSDRFGGVFKIVSGDYARHTGPELYTKLVLRRLLSKPFAFFYLGDYGAGLDVKAPVPLGAAARIKAEVERQVRLEPETLDVSASVVITADGIEKISIQAQIVGQSAPVTITITPDMAADFGPSAVPNPPPVPPPTPSASQGGYMDEDFQSPFTA